MADLVLDLGGQGELPAERRRAHEPLALGEDAHELAVGVHLDEPEDLGPVVVGHPVAGLDLARRPRCAPRTGDGARQCGTSGRSRVGRLRSDSGRTGSSASGSVIWTGPPTAGGGRGLRWYARARGRVAVPVGPGTIRWASGGNPRPRPAFCEHGSRHKSFGERGGRRSERGTGDRSGGWTMDRGPFRVAGSAGGSAGGCRARTRGDRPRSCSSRRWPSGRRPSGRSSSRRRTRRCARTSRATSSRARPTRPRPGTHPDEPTATPGHPTATPDGHRAADGHADRQAGSEADRQAGSEADRQAGSDP